MQDPSSYSQIKAPPQFPEQEHLKCPRCESLNTKFCYYNNYNLSQPRHFCKNCRRYWTKGGTLRNIPIGGGSRKNTKRSSNIKRPSSSSSTTTTTTSTTFSSKNTTQQAAVAAAPQPLKQEQEQQQQQQQQVPSLCDDNNNNNNKSGAVLLFDQQNPCALDRNQEHHHALLEIGGSFSSLLEGNGQFGDMLEGLNSSGSRSFQLGEFAENLKNSGLGSNLMQKSPIVEFQGRKNSDGFLGGQNGGDGDTSCWSNTNVNGWPDLAINTPTPGSSFQEMVKRNCNI